MLIALTGGKQHGKDTVANYLVTKRFKRFAFADRMREALYKLNPWVCVSSDLIELNHTSFYPKASYYYTSEGCFIRLSDLVDGVGWDIAKEDSLGDVRGLLQRFGTEAGREIHGEDCWVKLTFDDIARSRSENSVITDCRFENEGQITKMSGGTIWKIDRGLENTSSHKSENGLDPRLIDITINNYYLEEGIRKDCPLDLLYDTVDRVLEYQGQLC